MHKYTYGLMTFDAEEPGGGQAVVMEAVSLNSSINKRHTIIPLLVPSVLLVSISYYDSLFSWIVRTLCFLLVVRE